MGMFHSLLFIIIICSFILFEHIATSMLLMTLISSISFVIFPLKLRVECVNFTNQRWFSLQHFLVMFKKIYLQFSFFFLFIIFVLHSVLSIEIFDSLSCSLTLVGLGWSFCLIIKLYFVLVMTLVLASCALSSVTPPPSTLAWPMLVNGTSPLCWLC